MNVRVCVGYTSTSKKTTAERSDQKVGSEQVLIVDCSLSRGRGLGLMLGVSWVDLVGFALSGLKERVRVG
jgi:hypothetical protein